MYEKHAQIKTKIPLSEGAPVVRDVLHGFGCDAKNRILIKTFYNATHEL
jgi:hypothetical protein